MRSVVAKVTVKAFWAECWAAAAPTDAAVANLHVVVNPATHAELDVTHVVVADVNLLAVAKAPAVAVVAAHEAAVVVV